MSTSGLNDAEIRKLMMKHASGEELACKKALEAAGEAKTTPALIGRYADDMGLNLIACQLGLFGFRPEKKIVEPLDSVPSALSAEIEKNLACGRLPCSTAFEIAKKLGLGKMEVSSACETLKISIKPCQLGAF